MSVALPSSALEAIGSTVPAQTSERNPETSATLARASSRASAAPEAAAEASRSEEAAAAAAGTAARAAAPSALAAAASDLDAERSGPATAPIPSDIEENHACTSLTSPSTSSSRGLLSARERP